MQNQLPPPLKYLTRWYSDEILGQTLALLLVEHADEISSWKQRAERLLACHSGPFEDLGDGFALDEISGEAYQKLNGLRFAKLVLRKNLPAQFEAEADGWHVHAFYPIPQLPLAWPGDSNFRYLTRYIAGYFVSGVEGEGDGLAAMLADLKLVQAKSPASLEHLGETLEMLQTQSWPFEVAAAFWQEQLNRPLSLADYAPDLLAEWAAYIEEQIKIEIGIRE